MDHYTFVEVFFVLTGGVTLLCLFGIFLQVINAWGWHHSQLYRKKTSVVERGEK